MVLRHTDNLSKTLQDKTRSAAEGQAIADMVVCTLLTLRNDDLFELFWLKVTKKGIVIRARASASMSHKMT